MKKLILSIFMLFSLSSCATDLEIRLSKKYKNIHPEFQTYIYEFKQLSKGKVTDSDFYNFTMGFRKYKNGSSVAGTCHYGVNEVDINIEWWNGFYTPSERLELVFHELGHCILKRGHTVKPTHKGFLAWLERIGFKLGFFEDKGYIYDGCPASFMHPYTISNRCINKHFSYYINELFGNHEDSNFVISRSHTQKQHTENKYFKPKKPKCKKVNIINKTKTWNRRDKNTLLNSKRRCLQLHKTCLKTFIKKEELTYNAICE